VSVQVGEPLAHLNHEWAEPIPRGWQLVRLKHLARLYSGGTPDREKSEYWEDGTIPWLNSGEVNQWVVTQPSTHITEEGFRNSSAKWIPKGALVMALAGQGKTKGMAAQLAIDSTCNQSLVAIVPERHAVSRFLLWWLTANYETIRNQAGDELRDGLNLEIVGEIPCPYPAPTIQCAIADYLDRETARIDALVAAKERMVELLEQREHAVRTRIVSSSSTGTQYPRIRLKFLSPQIGVGVVVEPSKYFADQGVPFLHGSHITEAGIIFDPPKYMSAIDNARLSASRLRTDDVIVVRAGYPGRAVTVPPEFDGANCASIIIVRRGSKIVSRFLTDFLNSADGTRQVALAQYGAAQEQINVSHIVNFLIPSPSVSEQRASLERIKRTCAPLYVARQLLFRQIGLLQEHRQALITAAVTGQLDIPEAA
jgi:type I restriction enzyme, S subunit